MRIGPENNTATRLVKTLITETSSKLIAIIGVVAIWAAKESATWAWWRKRRVANYSVSERRLVGRM